MILLLLTIASSNEGYINYGIYYDTNGNFNNIINKTTNSIQYMETLDNNIQTFFEYKGLTSISKFRIYGDFNCFDCGTYEIQVSDFYDKTNQTIINIDQSKITTELHFESDWLSLDNFHIQIITKSKIRISRYPLCYLPAIPTQTESPFESPTNSPMETPTESPFETPTESPTESPFETPTESPFETPAESATESPTESATESPFETPTESATKIPSNSPFQTLKGPNKNSPIEENNDVVIKASKKSKILIIIISTIIPIAGIAIIIVILVVIFLRKTKKVEKTEGTLNDVYVQDENSVLNIVQENPVFQHYEIEDPFLRNFEEDEASD